MLHKILVALLDELFPVEFLVADEPRVRVAIHGILRAVATDGLPGRRRRRFRQTREPLRDCHLEDDPQNDSMNDRCRDDDHDEPADESSGEAKHQSREA
jgi:hypothetical protein